MAAAAQQDDRTGRARAYEMVWVVSVRYDHDPAWTIEAIFTTRARAIRAIEGDHASFSPPIVWRSLWADEGHGEDEEESCPGFVQCEECFDWRGLVDSSPWYRLQRTPLYDGSEGDTWRGYFVGIGEGLDGAPDYIPPEVNPGGVHGGDGAQ